jgi:hypothetical protein
MEKIAGGEQLWLALDGVTRIYFRFQKSFLVTILHPYPYPHPCLILKLSSQTNRLQGSVLLEMFEPVQYDVRSRLSRTKESEPCNRLLLSNANNTGIGEIFLSNQFSFSSTVGALEPLTPPLRHPKYCQNRRMLMDLSYLVHDFHTMCKNLKPTSRTIFVDMGASLDFHGSSNMPALYILNLYRKFGFYFDHIYAYEITPKEPSEVFEKVPSD